MKRRSPSDIKSVLSPVNQHFRRADMVSILRSCNRVENQPSPGAAQVGVHYLSSMTPEARHDLWGRAGIMTD